MIGADLAIDLGTANTLVHVRGKGVVLNEPSVVAIVKDGHQTKVLAVGKDAKEMLGKTPGHIVAIRPMRDGVIADFTVTEAMIKNFIIKAVNKSFLMRSRLIISVPAEITSIEQRAVREAALGAGVREVHLIEQPMAAAVGAGLPVRDARGSMIIDIGGGTTDVAVISLNGIVSSQTLRVAGDKLDQVIVNFIRKRHNILIGERTGELIKMKIGSACPLEKELEIEVKGRDLITGVPRSIIITSLEVREALQDSIRQFVSCTKSVLEKTPPELSADIIDRGIVLCGGGAQIKGLDKLLSEECGIPVYVADNPLHAVVDGVGKVLENIDTYRGILI
ncbi:rod shape-determining protein [Sulfobacillus acidophilus]|uniref:Cell shape-determining protein MreB n=1 Tax=Sulfobacillus acidophilus TaxID=53633 RepID=A0ABS3AVQ9_9FIRM|nr:rod shape-determining protein [Sulfobacillus acidophilus]